MPCRAWVTAAASVVVVATAAAEATVCSETGEPAPEVLTLMAATIDPANQAWLVAPDCSVETRSLETDPEIEGALYIGDLGIEHVISVPTGTTAIDAFGNPLSRGANFSLAEDVQWMQLSSVPSDLSTFVLPPTLRDFYYDQRTDFVLKSLDKLALPPTLKYFTVITSEITSLKNVQLPPTVEKIYISGSPLEKIDFPLPPSLEHLTFDTITTATFGNLEKLTIPSGLKQFRMSSSGTATIRGIKWPATLEIFDLWNTTVETLEIRQSDFDIFNKLTDPDTYKATIPASCRGSATLERLQNTFSVCVVSDVDFDVLYSGAAPPTTGSPSPTTNPPAGSPPAATSTTPTSPVASGPDSSSNDMAPTRPPTPRERAEQRVSSALDDVDDPQTPSTKTNRAPTAKTSKPATKPTANALPSGTAGGTTGGTAVGTTNAGTTPAGTNTATSTGGTTAGTAGRTPNGGTAGNASKSPTLPASSSTQSPEASPIVNGSSGSPSQSSLAIIVLACALSFVVGGVIYHTLVKAKQRRAQEPKVVDDSTNANYTQATTPAVAST